MLRFLKFAVVGSSGVVVNQTFLILAVKYLKIDYKIASLMAIETAIITNFILNYNWTWKDRKGKKVTDKLNAFVKFNISSFISAFFLNWITLIFLTEIIQIKFYISNLIGISVAACFNFLMSNFWAFKKK
ncbi:MAG: GtrA family protein [Chitinispirillales bacterium]|nr:GtrA family protein [Chitinispirillales bacterium]